MAASIDHNRWQRDIGDFAVRIEVDDIKGWLTSNLVVEEGTRVILLQGGAAKGELPPGEYQLGDLKHRFLELFKLSYAARTTALLFSAGDSTLRMLFRNLRTQDGLMADAALELAVGLTDAHSCLVNLMKGQNSVTDSHIESLLRGEITNVLQSVVRTVPAKDLYGNADLREKITDELNRSLRATLSRNGLQLNQVRSIEAFCPAYDDQSSKISGQLAGKAQDVEAAAEYAKLEAHLRETTVADKINKINNEREWTEFIEQARHEVGMKRAIRKEEMDELLRVYQESREDKDLMRKRLLQQIDQEHQIAMMRITHAGEKEAVDHQEEIERRRFKAKQERDLEAYRLTILKREEELRVATQEAEAQQKLRAAKHAEGLESLKKLKDIRGDEKDRDSSRGIAEKKAEADRKLSEIEALKGATPEQILAMAAQGNAAAADVLKEKFRSAGDAEHQAKMMAMYERMIETKDQTGQQQVQMQQQFMQMMKDMFNTGMQTQRDTASAAAGASSPHVVYPPGSTPQMAYPPGGGSPQIIGGGVVESRMCVSCGHQIRIDNKFCPQCGAKQA